MASAAKPANDTQMEDVDHQMSPSQWSHRMGADEVISEHCRVLAEKSEEARSSLPCELDVHYGDGEDETINVFFPPKEEDRYKTLLVYFHGGMWQALSKKDSDFVALHLTSKGFTVVTVEYTIAPKGSLALMVEQSSRALLHLHQSHPEATFVLAGHSAGGHLAAMMAWLPWDELGAPGLLQAIKGVVSVSGLFDLQPVQASYANEALKLADDEVEQLSPLRLIQENPDGPPCDCQHIFTIAQHEPDAFRQQSIDYAQALRSVPLPVCFVDMPDMDHFDSIERLADANYSLHSMIVSLL